ncbi:ATP-binding protein [Ornithinimicrobium sp. LYQ103]|uniref:ATP-binding protein n=1 Tax=Ornithinimicrobium sp. LYQ103 TaxID=3378796 RepID=UPI003852E4BF
MARLLADFGHDAPPLPGPPGTASREPRVFRPTSPRGPRAAGRGWAPAAAPVATWRMTSDQAPAFWPFIPTPALPPTGAQMGIDVTSGAAFHCDPLGWVLRPDVPITNPNIMCFGKPGTGKSATTKAFILRMMDFGYRTLILGDTKDEYESVCAFLGVQPIALGAGLGARVNPLALGPLGHGWEQLDAAAAQRRAQAVFGRWLTLVRALVGSQQIGEHLVPFGPTEEAVLRTALADLVGYTTGATHLVETTLPGLWHALDNPSTELVAATRHPSRGEFMDSTRLLRDALGQLVNGALAGLFDAHTNVHVDWLAPIQSLSLSRLPKEAVGIALTCLGSWGAGQREVLSRADQRVVVRDEAWRQLRLGPEAVKAFDADMRLSRGYAGQGGDIQYAVAHKPSDLLSAGDEGSVAQTIARDMLHLADIKILHGQGPKVAAELDQILGLGPLAVDAITGWARQEPGRAVWQVGDRMYKVATVLHPLEAALANTNRGIESAG